MSSRGPSRPVKEWLALIAAGLLVGALFNAAFQAAPWSSGGLLGGVAAAALLRLLS
ncbi:hypothetical protein AnaeK_0344 [Anaeromyxobacter sp. K]|uniref:hypothetical protein n=1 Tax=Anaeromyxobacter sp. (strain K) TaxID=447217 RepID=UPI00015F9A8D|nr:hypothetical protein [Anaeromyxobacter sp. K]ACG71586.1 hypothetical protein AnaeK_0344 [Anaeromyxobacter sp. K]